MEAPVIRRATLQDKAAMAGLSRIVLGAHHQALPHLFKAPEQANWDWPDALFENERWMPALAQITGVVVGYIEAIRFDIPGGGGFMQARRPAFINNIVVSRPRQGIGSALMRHVQDWAAANGATDIDLCCWSFNGDAQAFFKAQGFAPQHMTFNKRLG